MGRFAHTRRRHPARSLAAAMLGLAAAIGAFGPAVAGAAPAARTVPPDRWVRTACRAVIDFVDEASITDHRIAGVIQEVSEGDRRPASARRRMVALLGRVNRAGKELEDDLEGAGVPKVKRGAALARSFRETTGDMAEVYEHLLAEAKKLRTRNANRFAADAEETYTAELDDAIEIGNPLEVLEQSPELEAAIAGSSYCADVTDLYEGFASLGVSPGDCLDAEALPIDCAKPHTDEVILVSQYPAEPGSPPFPGTSAIEAWVGQNCVPAFDAYVGLGYDDSEYEIGWYNPTAETWANGDREMVCTISSADGSELTGSVRGAAT